MLGVALLPEGSCLGPPAPLTSQPRIWLASLRRSRQRRGPSVRMSQLTACPPQPALRQAPPGLLQQQRRVGPAPPAAAAGPVFTEGWPLWTAFALCAALGQLLERRTPLGGLLSAPLLSMLLALAAAAAGLLPTASGVADAIWTYLMPLGAALYLLECDLTQ